MFFFFGSQQKSYTTIAVVMWFIDIEGLLYWSVHLSVDQAFAVLWAKTEKHTLNPEKFRKLQTGILSSIHC